MTPAQRAHLNATHDRLSELAEDGDPANYEALRREAAEMCVLLMELGVVTLTGQEPTHKLVTVETIRDAVAEIEIARDQYEGMARMSATIDHDADEDLLSENAHACQAIIDALTQETTTTQGGEPC